MINFYNLLVFLTNIRDHYLYKIHKIKLLYFFKLVNFKIIIHNHVFFKNNKDNINQNIHLIIQYFYVLNNGEIKKII